MRWAVLVMVGSVLAMPALAQPAVPPTANGPATPPAAVPMPVTPAEKPARRPRMKFKDRFEAANTTHDGKLTLAQAQAGRMPQVVKHFDEIDVQHHGYVTLEDIRAYRRAMREQRRTQQGK